MTKDILIIRIKGTQAELQSVKESFVNEGRLKEDYHVLVVDAGKQVDFEIVPNPNISISVNEPTAKS